MKLGLVVFNGDGPATNGVAGVPVVFAAGVVPADVIGAVGLNGVNAIPVRSSGMNPGIKYSVLI